MGRVMGIDVGAKRVGVALSDVDAAVATPHATEEDFDSYDELVGRLVETVREQSVETVVVGWPLTMEGDEGRATREVDRFIEALRRGLEQGELEVTIERWDERLTSVEAERVLVDADVSRQRRRPMVDRVAASRILQSFLDAPGEGTDATNES